MAYGDEFDSLTDLNDRFYCNAGGRSVLQSDIALANSGNLNIGGWNTFDIFPTVDYCISNAKGYVVDGSDRLLQLRMRDDQLDFSEGADHDFGLFFRSHSYSDYEPRLVIEWATNARGAPNDEVRSLAAFDISSIPNIPSLQIADADLNVYAYQVDGSPADISPIQVWNVDYSNSIEGADFDPAPVNKGMYNSFDPSAIGWKPIDSTSAIAYAYNNAKSWDRGGVSNWFQVQFRPAKTSPDNTRDMQLMYGPSQSSNYPYLSIAYTTNVPVPMSGIVDNEACMSGSNILTICTNAIIDVNTCPIPPVNVVAYMISSNQIAVSWSAVPAVSGYTLFRSSVNDTNTATNISFIRPYVTTYIDNIATSNTYYYWLKSYHEFCAQGSIYSDAAMSIPWPNVVISKTKVVPAERPLIGDYIRYRIDFTNIGLATAFNVRIIDNIPIGTVYSQESMSNTISGKLTDEPDDDEGYCDGNQVIFAGNGTAPDEGGMLPAGSGGTYYFYVRVMVSGGNTIINQAYVCRTNSVNTNYITNYAVNITVVSQTPPDIFISKTIVSPTNTLIFGDFVTYRIDYTNYGETPAANVKITDIIPDYTAYVAGSMSNAAGINFWDSPNNDAASYDGTQVVFCVDGGNAPNLGGTLGADTYGSVYFTVQIININAVGLTNEAIISGNNFTTTNAIHQTIVSQIPWPNLSISKTKAAPLFVEHGKNLTYRIDYMNSGQATALNVKISDIIPANTTYVSNSMSNSQGRQFSDETALVLITNTLFSDDFETGNLSKWVTANSVSIQTTPLNGAYNVRLNGADAELLVNIDTTGYSNIIFGYECEENLENNDFAWVEWRANSGDAWILLYEFTINQGLGITNWPLPPAADNNPNLEIHFLTENGMGGGDELFLDDIEVTGERVIDEANYDGTRVLFCVDGGVTTNTGGRIAPGASGSLYFTVEITNNTDVDAVTNEAIIYGDNFTFATSILVTTLTQLLQTEV